MLVDLDSQDFKRLLELAREGFSRGWDRLDAKDRLDEIESIEKNIIPTTCCYCTEPATWAICGKHAHRHGLR